MNTIIWMVAGGLLGWIGYSVMRLNTALGSVGAVILGAVACILGGKQVAPIFMSVDLVPGGFSPSALFFAVATASAILVAAHMIQSRFL